MIVAVEWVGGWLTPALLGPWPAPSARPVYVVLFGPLYVSLFPWMLAEQRRFL